MAVKNTRDLRLTQVKALLSSQNIVFAMHTDYLILINVKSGVNLRLNSTNLKWHLAKKISIFESPAEVTSNLITGQGIDEMITAIGKLKKLTTKKERIAEVKRIAQERSLPKVVKYQIKAEKIRTKRWQKITPENLLYKLKCGESAFKEGSSLSKSARIANVKYEVLKSDLLSKGYCLNSHKKKE